MTLAELSRRTGLSVTMLRHYEQTGVFSRSGDKRHDSAVYDEQAARRLHFLAHARKLGFDLAFSRLMLDIMFDAAIPPDEREATVKAVIREVHERSELMGAFEDFLQAAMSRPGSNDVDPLAGVENLIAPAPEQDAVSLERVSQRSWMAMRRRRFAIR